MRVVAEMLDAGKMREADGVEWVKEGQLLVRAEAAGREMSRTGRVRARTSRPGTIYQ